MTERSALDSEFLYNALGISSKKIHIFESVTSTNTLMKEYAEKGCGEWEIILSRSQSGGRGRMGRKFFSPEDSGIYLSVLLRPEFSPQKAKLITTCAAVCACVAISRVCRIDADIKWVNDIYINEKKVAGILTEGAVDCETGLLKYAILGIGINVYIPKGGFPAEIESIAGAVLERNNDGRNIRELLAVEFVKAFMERYPKYLNSEELYREYCKRMFLIGREVDVLSHCGGDIRKAVVLGVERDFCLKVECEDMTEAKLFDGEVSLRLKKGF